ncbi:MAG: response regulator [Deltaproteobacteria bacterium]|nr:response regulator [Deltaproteobacteria bacterium]MBW2086704.1 response regulator [Deltaproteobacteria bacterium]
MVQEKKKRILVVDDAPTIRYLMTQRLEELGYEVRAVEGGQEALEMLQPETGEPFDLILLDQLMPGLDGMATFELMGKLFEKPPPVIMFTAHGSIHLAVEFMKIGGSGFVQKPVDFDVLDLELKRALEKIKLKQQRDEALTAKRVAQEAEVLVASASRGFDEPLTSIQGYADILLQTSERADRDALTGKILESAAQLKKAVDAVIEAALLGSGAMKIRVENVSLEEITPLILPEVERKAGAKGLRMRREIQAGLPAFQANRDELKRILRHLLENAVKFTGKGGITFQAEEEDEKIILSVIDTGIGIEERHLPTLFDGLRSGGIGGPGLCINRMLVELMGGEIEVESEFGRGTKFTLKLKKAVQPNQTPAKDRPGG